MNRKQFTKNMSQLGVAWWEGNYSGYHQIGIFDDDGTPKSIQSYYEFSYLDDVYENTWEKIHNIRRDITRDELKKALIARR